MNSCQLPIHEYTNRIMEAIDSNRVLVISGRTGCGKSTQVPKYILNKYPDANIAVCQPRRLAATCLAQRVSQEYGMEVGKSVGYQIGMESKSSDKTKIMYMTYGILIQQLLFNKSIQYTHIILDEVHERSLEMDFTFIALKKILDGQKNENKNNTKVIIMSATINSSQFAHHFSTHIKTQQFLKPKITYHQQQNKRNGRSNRNRDEGKLKLRVDIKFETEGYRQAESIVLPDKNKYKIVEYFAEDIKDNQYIPQYALNEDVRVKDDTFHLAMKLIVQHLKKETGDILIFVPGMFEIKFLKDLLIENGKVDPIQVIEVHSAYSEQLYKKLFVDKIDHKVIIATNIGQSSITLPFCKTVVDFCLTRKNITIKIKGYSRFETRVASKANLMQRAGRVGRISDGIVYRLIPKQLYQKLEDFDIPEIQCVSLDMVILRAKQIDKTYDSTLFEDPYEVFFNAIEPPKFEQIHSAIEYLLEEQAMVLQSIPTSSKTERSGQKFNATDLKITKTGQFMVTMPCNIRISKMILHSLELGITSTIVDIAAILLTQKQFFQHEDKRYSVEEWMHSIVGYDRGNYNDFLLRQRMFSHWRTLYYESYKKQKSRKSKQKQQNNEVAEFQKILQMFNNERITNTEWGWCNDRGISPWVMRDILRISESIFLRLQQAEIKIQRSNKQEVQNQMVLYCLCIAFEDTTCEIEWNLKNNYKSKEKIQNYVSIIQSEKFDDQDIREFMDPLKEYRIQHQAGGFIKITGGPEVMSKLLLPRNYNKGNLQKTSPFYQYLASNPPKVSYTYESSSVRERVRNVAILNDSINKASVRPFHNLDYMLITDKIFDSKGKYYMGACALVEKKTLILLKMMTAKDVLLEPHVSDQFFSRVVINSSIFQLPFLLKNQDIQVIKEFRILSQEQKSKKLTEPILLENSRRSKFYRLLTQTPLKPKIEPWTYVYNATVEKYKKYEQNPVRIEVCPQLRQINPKQSYFQRYKRWKIKQRDQMYLIFRLHTIKRASIICSSCWPDHLTLIEDLEAFCTQKGVLKLNQYRGSWVQEKNKDTLMCSRKHKIGHALNPDDGFLEYQSVLMYFPLGNVAKFDGKQSSINQIYDEVERGVEQMEKDKSKYYEFECKICSNYNEYTGLKRFMLSKQNMESSAFWKKISDHMYSKDHINNLQKFQENI